MKYPTIAKVSFWDEDEKGSKTSQVFLYADGPKDAVDQICEWFGEDIIDEFSVRLFEDGLVEVADEFVKKLEERRA